MFLRITKILSEEQLATVRASLEEAFMELTSSSVEYRAEVPGVRAPAATTTIGSGV